MSGLQLCKSVKTKTFSRLEVVDLLMEILGNIKNADLMVAIYCSVK
jgi:hypothetical protein